MNKRVLTLLLPVALLIAPLAHASEAVAALDAFHAALVEGNRERAMELVDPQAAFYESGHVERSLEEYASGHMANDMKFAATSKRTVLAQQVREVGNVATIWRETETAMTTPRGTPVKMPGLETAVMEKKDGKWRLVHVHWSSGRPK